MTFDPLKEAEVFLSRPSGLGRQLFSREIRQRELQTFTGRRPQADYCSRVNKILSAFLISAKCPPPLPFFSLFQPWQQRYLLSEAEEHHQLFDLIESMLEYEPSKRLPLSDALKHPFFENVGFSEATSSKSWEGNRDISRWHTQLQRLSCSLLRGGASELLINRGFVFSVLCY